MLIPIKNNWYNYTNADKEQPATTPGLHPAEKTSFVAINWISERWGWETGMGEGSVEQSWVFTYFSEVFFGGSYSMAPIGYEAGNELRNPSGLRSECTRAAKKRFGKVRKYQFCGQLTESIPVSHPHLSVHYRSFTKRNSSAKPQFNVFYSYRFILFFLNNALNCSM